MFRDRQQLRRWAARALVVWLFGIGAGIAQACMAPNHQALHGERTAPAGAVHVIRGEAAQPAGDSDHASQQTQRGGASGHDDSLVESICQDFCEKSALAIPPLRTALDKVQCDALLPAVGAMTCPVPATEPVRVSVPRQYGALAPPIRLAFLRLAL